MTSNPDIPDWTGTLEQEWKQWKPKLRDPDARIVINRVTTFHLYRAMGPGRSLAALRQSLESSGWAGTFTMTQLRAWSREEDWPRACAAWDAKQAEQVDQPDREEFDEFDALGKLAAGMNDLFERWVDQEELSGEAWVEAFERSMKARLPLYERMAEIRRNRAAQGGRRTTGEDDGAHRHRFVPVPNQLLDRREERPSAAVDDPRTGTDDELWEDDPEDMDGDSRDDSSDSEGRPGAMTSAGAWDDGNDSGDPDVGSDNTPDDQMAHEDGDDESYDEHNAEGAAHEEEEPDHHDLACRVGGYLTEGLPEEFLDRWDWSDGEPGRMVLIRERNGYVTLWAWGNLSRRSVEILTKIKVKRRC